MNWVDRLKAKYAEFKERGLVEKFSKVFILDILAKGSTFLFLPIFLKLMSQEEFGLYTYLFFIVTSLANILKLGFGTAKSKLFYDFEGAQRGTMLFTVNSFVFSFFALLMVATWFFDLDIYLIGLLVEEEFNYQALRVYFLLYVFVQMVVGFLNVFFVISDNIRVFQWYNLVRILGMNLLAIGAMYYVSTNQVLTRVKYEVIISLLIMIPLYFKYFSAFKIQFDFSILKRALVIGLPMMASVAVTAIYTLSDKFFLQKFAGFDTLAVYNLAIFLTTPFALVFTSFHILWVPVFFAEKNYQINFKKTGRATVGLMAFFVGFAFLIWGAMLLALQWNFIGIEYTSILWVLPIVLFAQMFNLTSQLYNNFVVLSENTVFTLVMTMVLSFFTLALNYQLTPSWGIWAASGIFFAMAIFRFTSFYLFAKYKIITPWININTQAELK
ncbi:MAG: oligosaccharide flippase family protein [Bacteroidota bacterium]